MLRVSGSFILIVTASILGFSPCSVAGELPDVRPDTLVVCPAPFQQVMVKWCDYRKQQGHVIKMITPPLSVEALKQTIQTIAKSGSLKHVLIVGDVGEPRAWNNLKVPTDFVKARVNVLFGSDPEIAAFLLLGMLVVCIPRPRKKGFIDPQQAEKEKRLKIKKKTQMKAAKKSQKAKKKRAKANAKKVKRRS